MIMIIIVIYCEIWYLMKEEKAAGRGSGGGFGLDADLAAIHPISCVPGSAWGEIPGKSWKGS